MDKGSNAERLAMRQAVKQQEQEIAQRQQLRVEPQQSLAEEQKVQPQVDSVALEPNRPKLSEREELIKRMLEQLEERVALPNRTARAAPINPYDLLLACIISKTR